MEVERVAIPRPNIDTEPMSHRMHALAGKVSSLRQPLIRGFVIMIKIPERPCGGRQKRLTHKRGQARPLGIGLVLPKVRRFRQII